MKEKDAAIIKVLSDIGYSDEPELTHEQEEQFERALDPEKQFLHDVEKLFTPQIQEGKWDDPDERKNSMENPIPFPSEEMNDYAYEVADAIDRKIIDEYKRRTGKKSLGIELGNILKQGRAEFGNVEMVPINKILASERTLDREHLLKLVKGQSDTEEIPRFTIISGEYYAEDGNHRIAAAAFRGEEEIKGLVLDPTKIINAREIDESTWAEEDGVRDRENPLPVVDASKLASVSSNAEYIYQKTADEYGEVSIENLQKIGKIEAIPVSKIIGSEDYLDGEHINALVSGDIPSDDVIMAIKMRDKYYLLDGNHKAAAAKIRGEKNIKALVFDINSI